MNNATEISEDVGEVGITDVQVTIQVFLLGINLVNPFCKHFSSLRSLLLLVQKVKVSDIVGCDHQSQILRCLFFHLLVFSF